MKIGKLKLDKNAWIVIGGAASAVGAVVLISRGGGSPAAATMSGFDPTQATGGGSGGGGATDTTASLLDQLNATFASIAAALSTDPFSTFASFTTPPIVTRAAPAPLPTSALPVSPVIVPASQPMSAAPSQVTYISPTDIPGFSVGTRAVAYDPRFGLFDTAAINKAAMGPSWTPYNAPANAPAPVPFTPAMFAAPSAPMSAAPSQVTLTSPALTHTVAYDPRFGLFDTAAINKAAMGPSWIPYSAPADAPLPVPLKR
jgi:hypothetical protein